LWIGRPVEVAVLFTGAVSDSWDWIEGPDWRLAPMRAWLQAKSGRQISYRFAMMPRNMGITLAQIAAGQHDARYITAANNLAKHGLLSIQIVPGWEMNGRWYPWHAEAGSGNEAAFAAAYRRIVTVMRNAQPTNKWKWVWNPAHTPPGLSSAQLESLWPGDQYVNEIGVDAYDASFRVGAYYPSGSDRLQRQQEVWSKFHGPALKILSDFARKHGKPMSFPEWGLHLIASRGPTNEADNAAFGGGDNPYFIEQMHKFFMDPANNVVMHAYFEAKNTNLDTRVGPDSVMPLSQAKFKQLFGAGSD
jgi:hypothetical protein